MLILLIKFRYKFALINALELILHPLSGNVMIFATVNVKDGVYYALY